MHILLRERDPVTRQRRTLVELQAPARDGPLSIHETTELELIVVPDDPQQPIRVRVGGMLLASTIPHDRAPFAFQLRDDGERESLYLREYLLRDWVGLTDLSIEVPQGDSWVKMVELFPLHITAGKITQEEFEAICEAISAHSAAALLDVYGKTFFGLELEQRPGERAPVATLQRIRSALEYLAISLREIAAQPAYRLKTRRVREPAIAEQSVSDLTLEEACLDPSLAVRHATGIRFREQVREEAVPHFNLTENRILSGFLNFLGIQLADLETRLLSEIAVREERKAYRRHSSVVGEPSWWETEDQPRIAEARRLLEHLGSMRIELARLKRYSFLPPGAELREMPQSTPLIRSHRAYASAFKVVLAHFQSFRVRLGEDHLLTRGKSLPVLYEWWCVLEVMRILQTCLRRCDDQPHGRGGPFRRLESERVSFVVEFTPDQAVDFEDDTGRLIRLRYVPSYRPDTSGRGLAYGLLSYEEERTPDIAIEIFPTHEALNTVPELIIVFDAKYTTVPHRTKLEEMRSKYDKIGIFETGRVLSRQAWALVPGAPQRPQPRGPDWSRVCTVDNSGFWSEHYDMLSTTIGVVQAKPQLGMDRPSLESLVRLLLRRAGVGVRL